MSDSFPVDTRPRCIVASDRHERVLMVGSGSTVYYKGDASVSASSNDGSLAVGSRVHIRGATWVVSAGESRVVVTEDESHVAHQFDLGSVALSQATPDSSGIYIDDYLTSTDDAAIDAAIAAATAVGTGTPVIAASRTYSISSLHVFDQVPLVGSGTKFLATNAAAGLRFGTANGVAPRNLGKTVRCGGFHFDGGGLATQGVTTNTVHWHYDPFTVTNLAANAHGLQVLGQNNEYSKPLSAATGTGFALVFDNGAGGNRLYAPYVAGGNQILFTQTVNSFGYTYPVPEDNLIDSPVGDQPVTGTYAILHLAGADNVIRDANLVHRTAAALVKWEPNTGGYVGAGFANGALVMEGRNELVGNGEGSGQFAFWADFVNGGTAGAMAGDVALIISGELKTVGVDGDFKWGCTTPVIGHGTCYIRRFPGATTRPLWTADGSGALADAQGNWRVGSKVGFNGLPDLSLPDLFQIKQGALLATLSGAELKARSGNAGFNSWLSLGRTAEDAQIGIPGTAGSFFVGTSPGDLALRQWDATKEVHIGVDPGAAGNQGAAAAELVVGDAKLGFFAATPVVQQSVGAAASDAATTQTLANNLRTALINLGLCKT